MVSKCGVHVKAEVAEEAETPAERPQPREKTLTEMMFEAAEGADALGANW